LSRRIIAFIMEEDDFSAAHRPAMVYAMPLAAAADPADTVARDFLSAFAHRRPAAEASPAFSCLCTCLLISAFLSYAPMAARRLKGHCA
jgi:hypothetical protein